MKQHTVIAVLLGAVATAIVGCLGADEVGASEQPVVGVNLMGETVLLDPRKVCWETVTPIPEGYVAMPDPERNAFRFVRNGQEVSTFEDDSADYGGDGITCTCTSGTGCSPAKLGSRVGCVMGEKCNSCTKS